jgi:Domain of unknown function (DUF4082)/Bacterial Ig-like domain
MAPASITATSFLLRDPSANVVPATVSFDASTDTARLVPNASLLNSTTYTVVVKGGAGGVTDTAGNPLASDFTSTFTTIAGVACPCTIWSSSTTPATAATTDTAAYELGVRFRSDQSGYILGVRFYKGTGNTGTHVGRLWTNTGTKLAQATFSGETATGWQEVQFATPVAIAANTTYVASYSDPRGRYALSRPYFTNPFDNPPLHALANGFDGANGLFTKLLGAFPSDSFSAGNYWIDVVYSQTPPPTVTARTPAVNANDVSVGTTVTATFSPAMDASTLTPSTFTLTPSGGPPVAAAVTFDAATQKATLTPSAPLAYATTYTATLTTGVKTAAGVPLRTPITWSFTTEVGPPTVTATTPATGATGVAANIVVTASFSRPLSNATVTAANFTLAPSAGGAAVAATVAYDPPNQAARLTPTAPLAAGTAYTATLTTGITASDGTPLAAPYSWTFTTGP